MTNKLKVCHVANLAGSLDILLRNQLLYLRERCGYEVHGAAGPSPYAVNLTGNGIPFHPVALTRRISPAADVRAFFKLFFLFRKEKFDIVHVHTPKAALIGALAAFAAGVPVRVNTIHGFYFHEQSSFFSLAVHWAAEFLISRCVHNALSQNREDFHFALRTHLYSRGRISVLGNGVDLSRFRPAKISGVAIRDELGISRDAFVMGIVGRVTREKGYQEFIEALVVLAKRGYPVEAIAIGPSEGKARDIMTKLAGRLGIRNRIRFVEWRDDIERWYGAFDVFVLPSYREGFPRTPMEAFACGIPCVLTDIRGCREIVTDGVDGFLVPVGSSLHLVERIARLIEDPALRNAMGREARKKALRDFDEKKVFQRVAAVYAEIGGNKQT